jgi:prephenate dehydrogenase
MASLDHERIGIVGLGAIGGSLALALRGCAPLIAWTLDGRDREAARGAGIRLCREATWAAEMAEATAIVIAVPLDEVASVVRELLPRVGEACLVMHASSLQRRDAVGLSEPAFQRVFGTHPLAGSERSGFAAANPTIFRDATVRAEARADAEGRARIELVWRAAGISRLVWDDASTHDAIMAWISHLPQLTGTALAAVLAEHQVAPDETGPGARDTTRLAASDLAIWAPILERAPRETTAALRQLTRTLTGLADALEARDEESIARTWREARSWRARLEDRT